MALALPNPLHRDNPVSLVLAPILWSLYFLLVYVTNSVACAKGWTGLRLLGLPLVDGVVALATGVTLALLLGLAWLSWSRFRPLKDARDDRHETDPELATRARRRFMALAGLLQAGLHIAATLYVALQAAMVAEC